MAAAHNRAPFPDSSSPRVPLSAALLPNVARSGLAETANPRCLSSKVKPAQVSMAGEAYQCFRPSLGPFVRPNLPAPSAHTIASEPRVRRRRRPVALSPIEVSWLEPRSEHGMAVHGRALSRSAWRDAVPAATQQNQAVGERALPPNPRPAARPLGVGGSPGISPATRNRSASTRALRIPTI